MNFLNGLPGWASLLGIPAIISVIVNAYFQRKSGERLAELNAKFTERLQASSALRDYEYEARKRLYEDCLPILFQLLEASETAARRIRNLARASRNGALSGDKPKLMTGEYYLHRTVYTLFAPLALFVMLRRTLTVLDLGLDSRISVQYQLAKILYRSFTQFDNLAKKAPQLALTDKVGQGLALGELENILDCFIEPNAVPGKGSRLISFAEFDRKFEDKDNRSIKLLTTLFLSFNPESKPVLWRVLIAQAHIYRAILKTNYGRETSESETPSNEQPSGLPTVVVNAYNVVFDDDDRKKYLLQGKPTESDKVELNNTFEAARAYYRRQLQRPYPELKPPLSEQDDEPE